VLFGHVLGYAPANVLPALVSFLSIYVFTRLVSPQEYGRYALVVSVTLLCQAAFFYWLQVGTTRFVARAHKEGRLPALVSTAYRLFLVAAVVLSALYAAALYTIPGARALRAELWLGLALILARSLTALNQAFTRGGLHVWRYNLVECGQSLLGFAIGLLLIKAFKLADAGILLGLIAGALVVALPGLLATRGLAVAPIDGQDARLLLRFGLPLTAYCAMNYMLATSDRLLVEHFLGPAAVGVYSVSYNLADKAVTSVFLAVSLAAFPLAVSKLEREGPEAARHQLYRNGTALLGLAIPASAGLIALCGPLTSVLVGPSFREEARQILPWIAMASVLCGLQVHFFDHAFHLGRRTELCVFSIGPAVLLNLLFNVLLLPRFGLMGAVYATLAGYAVALAGSILVGRRVFQIRFPFRPLLRVLSASAVMVLVLELLPAPVTTAGLLATILLGAISYGAAAVALDVGGLRAVLLRLLPKAREPMKGRAL
jgi:O-antigen/teichoic acid export membrane protein